MTGAARKLGDALPVVRGARATDPNASLDGTRRTGPFVVSARRSILVLAWATLACGSPSHPPRDAGMAGDGGESRDSGFAADGGPSGGPLPDGAPFATAAGTWEYEVVEGASCGNGSPLGVAVQRSDASDDVLLYFAGGGACWDAASCFALRAAVHIDEDLGEGVVLAEAQAPEVRVFLDRDDPSNAFPNASYVYVPYCTGDLHAGTRIATYDVLGMPRVVHHVGAFNVDRILARMRATWPDADHVWLAGQSAGGYGATMNWWRVAEAFPDAEVDALSDSGLPIAPEAGRLRDMREAWAPRWPSGCVECASGPGFGALLAHYAATRPSEARYGLLTYRRDAVIGLYFALDIVEVERRLATLRAAAAENQRTFYIDGTDHVLTPTPGIGRDGVTVAEFVRRFATRDASWEHVGP